jgi:hypothetical protein
MPAIGLMVGPPVPRIRIIAKRIKSGRLKEE